MAEEKDDTIQNNPLLDAFSLATDPQAKVAYLEALKAAVPKRPRVATLGLASVLLAYEDDDQRVRNGASDVLKTMLEVRPSLFTARTVSRVTEAYVNRVDEDLREGSMYGVIHPLLLDESRAGHMVDTAIALTEEQDQEVRGRAMELLSTIDYHNPAFSEKLLPVAVGLLSDTRVDTQLSALTCVEEIIQGEPERADVRILRILDDMGRTASDPKVRAEAADVVRKFQEKHAAHWELHQPNRTLQNVTQRLGALAR